MRFSHVVSTWAVSLLAFLTTVLVESTASSPGLSSQLAVRIGRQIDRWKDRRIEKSLCNKDACATSRTNSFYALTVHRPHRGGATATAIKTMTKGQKEALNLLSGGIAGTVAACLTNPLEVVKAQLQSSLTATGTLAAGRGHPLSIAQRIVEQDGVAGFFRGLPATLIGIIPARSAYFYAYERSKKALGPYFSEGSPPNAMISGFMAGITSNTLTNPIWMVRTRMQLLVDSAAGQRAYNGYADAIRTIFREEGIGGFYKGISASYWGCTEGAVQFILYEQFKMRLLRTENRLRARRGLPPTDHLSKLEVFLSAAAAKMCASIATYPHEVARTRMREQARSGVFKYNTMWQTLSVIAREEGRQGLYSGLGMHLVKVVPNSALMFLTYEVVNKWLGGFTIVDEESEQAQLVATETSRRKNRPLIAFTSQR